jgi:hypothetical protein
MAAALPSGSTRHHENHCISKTRTRQDTHANFEEKSRTSSLSFGENNRLLTFSMVDHPEEDPIPTTTCRIPRDSTYRQHASTIHNKTSYIAQPGGERARLEKGIGKSVESFDWQGQDRFSRVISPIL